jgi:hypothetical protein
VKERSDLHGDYKAPPAGVMYQRAMEVGARWYKSLQGLKNKDTQNEKEFWFGNENSTPPERTVRMNEDVAPLYFLLYSAVQYFSSLLLQGASETFSAASSSVKGRRVSPSRSLAGHQFDWGWVRLERWVIGCRRDLEGEDPASFLEVAITFAPKNRRISISGFRCESETDNSL